MGYNKCTFNPENYILLGHPISQMNQADTIIAEEKTRFSDKFEGTRDAVRFKLRYVAPFDKSFHELKRLQGTAAEAAGRRDEFKGYIVIDLSDWLTHHDEDYFETSLLFLVDMSEHWKYIFLVENQNAKAAKELVSKILSVLYRDNVPCMVKEENVKSSNSGRISALCKEQSVMCSAPVKEFLRDLLEQGFNENVVAALLSEMTWSYGKKLSMNTLVDYTTDQESIVRYMVTQKEFDRLLATIEKRKEQWYGEKEAV